MKEQVTTSPSQDRADATTNFVHQSGPQPIREDQPASRSTGPHNVPLRAAHLGGSEDASRSYVYISGSTRQEPSVYLGQADSTENVEPVHFAGHESTSIDVLDEILVQVHNLRTNQAHLRNMVLRQQEDIDRLRVSFERFVARLLDLELMVNLRQA